MLAENALHVEDVLVRRVRLFIESADSGTGAAAEVSLIMGRLLGWNRRKRNAETRRYLELVAAEQAPAVAARPGNVLAGPGLAAGASPHGLADGAGRLGAGQCRGGMSVGWPRKGRC